MTVKTLLQILFVLEVWAMCKGHGASFIAKKIMDGFFKPDELISKTSAEIIRKKNSTGLSTAVKQFSLVLEMCDEEPSVANLHTSD